MEENEAANSNHFFKFMIPGFQNKLNLPPSFCKKLKQEKSEWATLTSRKGTSKIKVCRDCEGVISFEDGWPQFVDSHSLSVGDFLEFEHVVLLKFNVSVFGASACEKEFLNELHENTDDHETVNPSCPKERKRKEKMESTVISYNDRNLHFSTTVTPYLAGEDAKVSIPIEFVRLNKLQHTTSATLRNADGRLWSVTLLVTRFSSPFRICLYKGWHDFYVSNELKVGDVCVFNLNPGPPTSKTILFDVQIHPKKREEPKESTVISYDNTNPHFIRNITPFLARELAEVTIPIELVRLNNLKEKTSATLRDGRGRLWPVTLRPRRLPFAMSLYRGWHDFYVSNELKDGDVCVFYLIPGSPTSTTVLFDVEIIPSV